MRTRYYFRVDANDRIGIGHMMRCFSIAKALRQKGCEATFFVADRTSARLAAEHGYGYVCLNSDYDHLDVEADMLIEIMRERGVDNLLVDSYFVTESYLKKIRTVANVVYMDDINKFIYPCDLLIDYNIYAEELDYERRYREAGLSTKFALGLSYMPLREEYLQIRRHPHEGLRMFITTGATDSYDVLGHLLEAMTAQHLEQDIAITGVIGQYNHNRDSLLQRFGGNSRIHLIDPQSTLSELIAQSDFAVTAGGTTVYELCAGGLPSVMVTLADNQMRAAREFDRRGIIPYAGDVRTNQEQTIESVIRHIRRLSEDAGLREQTSAKMRTVVDGRGAERIAQLLLDNAK